MPLWEEAANQRAAAAAEHDWNANQQQLQAERQRQILREFVDAMRQLGVPPERNAFSIGTGIRDSYHRERIRRIAPMDGWVIREFDNDKLDRMWVTPNAEVYASGLLKRPTVFSPVTPQPLKLPLRGTFEDQNYRQVSLEVHLRNIIARHM